MTPVEIVSFDDSLIEQAGELLAGQWRRLRAAQPNLPPEYEQAGPASAQVLDLWNKPGTGGFAVQRDGRLAGYLLGERLISPLWGRSAWVRLAGCALAEGEDPGLAADLYAALGQRWVAAGIFAHFVLAPVAHPSLVHTWFSLSFGVEQVHALLDLQSFEPSDPGLAPGIAIWRAGREDRQALADLSDVIWRHQVQAPVWGIQLPESQQRQDWADLADDPEVRVWLARLEGQVVGIQGYLPVETPRPMQIPAGSFHLTVAGVRPTARRLGIGRALTQTGLADMKAAGQRWIETDWRSTNLLSTRFWPRQGFRPLVYRLVRRIDERIAWAHWAEEGEVGSGPC